MKIKHFKYDKYMDEECIVLCDALSSLKGIQTFESCCGHYKDTYDIWFNVKNWHSLEIITRTFDRRYSNGLWKVSLDTPDFTQRPYKELFVHLHRTEPFKDRKELDEEMKLILESLQYWSDTKRSKFTCKPWKFKKEDPNCYE